MTDHDQIVEARKLSGAVTRLFEKPQDMILPAEIVDALAEATHILDSARSEAEALREEARQTGLAEGLAQTVSLLQTVERQRIEATKRGERDVVELALATARKLLGRSIELDPTVIVSLVERAMRTITRARKVVIWVAEEHQRALNTELTRLSNQAAGASVTIQTEPSLRRGDCIIETDLGRIDARLDIQFQTIVDALLGSDDS